MNTGLIRIVSPSTEKPSKRIVLHEDRVEVWINDDENPDSGSWIDISGAVKSACPKLVYGQPAMADLTFYIAGTELHSLSLTPESIAGLRAFLEQLDADGRHS